MWHVEFEDEFEREFQALPDAVQVELLARAGLLRSRGPKLGRPHADTLKGSAYANMKELRFNAGEGVWRVAFAFDPERRGIVLVAGDKSGVGEKRFDSTLIAIAYRRYGEHLARLKTGKKER
jgi:hypothetical protein